MIRSVRGKVRLFAVTVLAGVAVFATLVLGTGAASGASVDPVFVPDNPSCADLGYDFELKVEPVVSGTYTDGTLTIGLSVSGTSFDWTSNIGVDAVIAKGGPDANVYVYDPESFGDTGLHAPINPSNGQPFGLSHISFCYDLELDVSKTAETSFTRTWDWEITKTADAEYDLFRGDTQEHEYTVSVDKTGFTDSDWAVSGTITIENNTPADATIQSVTDVVSDGINATVDCGVSFPYTLDAGDTLECTYETALPDGTNRTNTATVTTSGIVGGNSGTADVTFGDPTTVVNGTINVDDTNGGSWQFSDSGSVSYTRTFACDADEGTHVNTATIVETGQSDDATVTINCYELTVTKDATVSEFSQDFFWEITKGDDAEYDMFTGDTQDHRYTIEITRLGLAAESALVTGNISVSNEGNPIPADITGVSDVLSGTGVSDVDATVDCGGSFPITIAADDTLECTYSATVDSSDYDLNTATASLQNYDYDKDGIGTASGTTEFSGTAPVSFVGVTPDVSPVTIVDDNATPGDASDDHSFGPFTDSDSVTYDRTFACDDDEGTHTNTASVVDAGDNVLDSDTATVVVNCYALDVTKDVDTSLTRTWDWTIDKSADQTDLLLAEGQLFQVNYEVTVDASSTDSDWAVSGSISVNNPAPIDATINSVSDIVSPAIAATVDCGETFPYTLVAGDTLNCTYDADLPDATDRTNTATATLQNHDYDLEGVGTASGTTDFSFTTNVSFAGATVTEIDECIDVNDTNVGFLGTVCAADAPTTFNYSLLFGAHPDADVVLECGDNTHVNTASFVTNDTGATGSDDATVNANVACVEGCTLTQGYWKTHSIYGPAPNDDAWYNLGDVDGDGTSEGAGEDFFNSGKTYYQVLWTPPAGNAYYNLAHQYIAAKLNILNGADSTPEVDAAITFAENYFSGIASGTPAPSGNLRKQVLAAASTLDKYNNGLIGPGHCSEDGFSLL